MHPVFQSTGRVLTFLLVWAVVGLLLTIGFAQDQPWLAAAIVFVPLAIVFGFISLSGWYICKAFPFHSAYGTGTLAVVLMTAATLASLSWVALAHSYALLLNLIAPTLDARATMIEQRSLLLVTGVLLFALTLAIHYLLLAIQDAQEKATQSLELRLAATRAELAAVRAQINPHFLFNSLNSISALVTTDARNARRMCLELASYFRDTLRKGTEAQITLAAEVALAQQYLAIEKIRFGERLQVAVNMPEDAMNQRVPSLILQPLIENAIVHGIAGLLEGGTLVIEATTSASYLTIAVENPVDPDASRTNGLGFGLKSLRRRLAAQYADGALINIEATPGRFRVELKLPADLRDEAVA
jgi:two-component system sensor histidine kinase AlgZ